MLNFLPRYARSGIISATPFNSERVVIEQETMRFSIAAAHAFGLWIGRYPGLMAQRSQDVGRAGVVHPDCEVVNAASADQQSAVVSITSSVVSIFARQCRK